MSDNENKNIGGDMKNSMEVNIDKESAFLRELLFGDDKPKAPTDDADNNVDSQGDSAVSAEPKAPENDIEPEAVSAEPQAADNENVTDSADVAPDDKNDDIFGQFSDFLTDSGEPKEEKEPENEFSSRFKTDSYNTEDMPHFFTESSEYEDEQPLDVSDFYPPVKSDEDMYNDESAADISDNSAPADTDDFVLDADSNEDVTETPELDEQNTEFEQPPQDNFDDFGGISDEPEPDSDRTRVFDAINDDYAADTQEDIDATRIAEPITSAAHKRDAAPEKKPNIFIRLLSGLLPWKGDSKKEIARKIVLIAAYITIITMGWQILSYYVFEPMNNIALTEKLHDMYMPKDEDYSSAQINPKFGALYDINNDLVGWIKVRDTNIDYPVLKGDTNAEYERNDIYHNYTRYGSIFMESSSSIDYGAESRNIVVYGHNMRDDSSMFSQLTHYRDFEFYKNHATFLFDSLYNDGTWKIFSIMTTNAYPAQDDGRYFDFRKGSFVDDAEFNSWIEGCRIRSYVNTGVDVLPTDTVLTLQTCVYEFTDARLVIMARRARPGESKDVDVSRAVENPNPRYPQAWYDAKGVKNPYADGNIPENANYLPEHLPTNKSHSIVLDVTPSVTVEYPQNSTVSEVTTAVSAMQPQPIITPDNDSDSSYRPSSGTAVQQTTRKPQAATTKKPQTTTKKTQSTTKKPASTTKTNITQAPTQAPTKAPTHAPTQPPTEEEYEPNAPY